MEPNCQNQNHSVLRKLEHTKPQKVVLDAVWFLRRDAYKKLHVTVSRLRDAGISDIVVIGPLPYWEGKLPTLLATEYMKSGQIPNRMKPLDYELLLQIDHNMSELCKRMNISYLSPVKLLCNKDGCLTMASDDPSSVMTFDSNHLTGNGSDYLVSRFKDDPAFMLKPH